MKAPTLRRVRQYHNYIAVFFAPAILFFAFTGALQTIGLHDPHDGIQPPGWIVAIANLHQHQVVSTGHHHHDDGGARTASATPRGSAADHDEDHGSRGGFVLEKPFVLLVAIALFVTTALGMVIAVSTPSTRRMSLILIVAGVAVPLLLLL